MFDLTDDTIVAVSSASGRAPRGIVRVSGPAAVRLGSALFKPDYSDKLDVLPGFTRTAGRVALEPGVTAPAECYLFRAPHSQTRQDCCEIHTVSAPPLLAMITERFIALGARPAEPGEFTARAFCAGAIDLVEVEAVAATIRARSDAQLRAAREMSSGHLAAMIRDTTDGLSELTSLVEADIDFAEEPIDFVSPAVLRRQLTGLLGRLEQLLNQAASTERLEVLPTILLAGVPNVGKSSLLNALTGMNRAICSAVAGTTRDVLSAPLSLRHGEAILLDTAGHQTERDMMSALTRQATASATAAADLVCLVVDASRSSEHDTRDISHLSRQPNLIAVNKVDLVARDAALHCRDYWSEQTGRPVVLVSATTGAGLERLKEGLEACLNDDRLTGGDGIIALTARQKDCLQRCRLALERAFKLADRATDTLDIADVLALDLREALNALGTLTGNITTEDLLERVFARFCIGK